MDTFFNVRNMGNWTRGYGAGHLRGTRDEQTAWEECLEDMLPDHVEIDPLSVSAYIQGLLLRIDDLEKKREQNKNT